EGRITPASTLERYAPSRRRAIVVATLLDLERRLTDAALSMADRLIGASFTRGKAARERTFVATSRDVGRLMRLLAGTAGAVATAMKENGDALAAIDAAVGLDRLIAAKPQAAEIADVAEEDPLVRAADRWMRLRKYGPMLIEAIDFKAARADDRTVAALTALRDLNRSGKRDLPKGT
ncbi:Tn3 family transposase, partial [Pseudoalteromonas sp. CR1]|nr:Tn3 family transposase [Pseudoalteromonas sp. CR1]